MQHKRLRRVLDIGICVLFVIWCLEFVISDTKIQGIAIYLRAGTEDKFFKTK